MQILICLILLSQLLSCTGKEQESSKEVVKQFVLNDSIPLFIVGTYLHDQTSISMNEIIQGVRSGKITITSDIRDFVKSNWNIDQPRIQSLQDWNDRFRNNLILLSIDSLSNRFLPLAIDSMDYFTNPKNYQLHLKSNHAFSFEKHITTYIHTGVTALTRSTGIYLDRNPIEKYVQYIKPYFASSELVHISNEVSIDDTCSYAGMRLSFLTKTKHMDVLKALRANIIELTGNHNLDRGIPPYLKALNWYKQNDMKYFGGGANAEEANTPLIFTLKDSTRIAWIGFNERCPLGECAGAGPGANRYSDAKAKSMIDSLRKMGINTIIACIQFSEVDGYTPHTAQRTISKRLIDYGADILIGSQAHVVQEIGMHKGKMLFYGTGNFLFDQTYKPEVRRAFFLQCAFYNGRLIQTKPVYTFMRTTKEPDIASSKEREIIRDSILKAENF
jgi:poly-gamma-glutamate capsule biosynthesis protein CapA/YwtB (metallophosphatase superfamily)